MKYVSGLLLFASSAMCGSAFHVPPAVTSSVSRNSGQHAHQHSVFSKSHDMDAPSSEDGKDTRRAFLEKARYSCIFACWFVLQAAVVVVVGVGEKDEGCVGLEGGTHAHNGANTDSHSDALLPSFQFDMI